VTSIVLALMLLLQRTPYIPPGAVEGMLKSVDGAPASAVRVAAFPVPKGNGTPDDNLNYFEMVPATNTTLTDNDGHFAMMDLAPGRYYIIAGAQGYGTWFPGTTDLRKATIVTVTSNEVSGDLNFSLMQKFGAQLSGSVKADMALLGPRTATLIGGKLEDLIEVPVKPDGSYQFGYVPPGNYLVQMYPPTSGMPARRVTVGNESITGVELIPLPTQTVTGRIVTKRGPLPVGYLGFQTDETYVDSTIHPDGTFTVQLHAATHEPVMAGLPIGYSIASVRLGSMDVTKGITVGKSDISDVVITLDTPQQLAAIKGKVSGLAVSRYATTRVEIKGPITIIGSMQTTIREDGTFEFPAVTPGSYALSLTSVPEFTPLILNLDSTDTANVSVVVPSR
jgi:hypothetical protein